jgi:hypothetical protein
MAEKSAAAPIATPDEVAKLAEAQDAEYGTFIAAAPIAFNGANAYNAGDIVPVSNVKKYGYDTTGQVVKIGSAAAQKIVGAVHSQNATVQQVEVPVVSLGVPVKD